MYVRSRYPRPTSRPCHTGTLHTASTVYAAIAYITRSSVMEYHGNLLIALSTGAIVTSSGERVHLFKQRAGSKTVYEDTTTPPATTTPVWHQGDTWVNLAAAAGAVCEWQNVAATGATPNWKAKATAAG